MFIQEFQILQRLGQGSYGQVVKVKRLQDNKFYAMKKVTIQKLKHQDKKNAINQIKLLASIKHQNVISYKQAFYHQETKTLNMIMQLATQGDLQKQIKQKKQTNDKFQEWFIWKTGYQILLGLQALHALNILHRDLKPANIFFSNNIAKIGDMNVSKLLQQNNLAQTQIGTPYYASPQIWNNQPYKFQCDIWSFGCIMYEMCNLKTPFRANNVINLAKKIRIGKFQSIKSPYSQTLKDIIGKCLKLKNRAPLIELIKVFQQNVQLKIIHVKSQKQQLKKINVLSKFPKRRFSMQKLLPEARYSKIHHIKYKYEDNQIKKQEKLQKHNIKDIRNIFSLKDINISFDDKNKIEIKKQEKVKKISLPKLNNKQLCLVPIKKAQPFYIQLHKTPSFEQIKLNYNIKSENSINIKDNQRQQIQLDTINHLLKKNKRYNCGIFK